jgi:hypothetical protein
LAANLSSLNKPLLVAVLEPILRADVPVFEGDLRGPIAVAKVIADDHPSGMTTGR